MNKYDVAIIGSGISGLSSALLFAKRGKKTVVFEQASKIAPLLSGFDRKEFHFETGFHYSGALGDGEAGGFLFRELGISIPLEKYDDNVYDEMHLLKSNRIFKIPVGKQNLIDKFIEFFPKEKEKIIQYFNLIDATIKQTPFLNIHKKGFLKDDIFRFNPDKTSLKEVLDSFFIDDELKALLSFSSVLYGTPPSKAAFSMHCSCAGIMNESIWKIKGGALSLVNIMQTALKEKGVDVFLNKRVSKIEIKGNEKILHFSDGSQTQCDMCVSSIHPKEFIKIAPPNVFRTKSLERIENIPETPGFFTIYAAHKNRAAFFNCTNKAFLKPDSYENDHKDFMYINFSNFHPQSLSLTLTVPSDKEFWDIPKNEYEKKKKKLILEIKNNTQKYMDFDFESIEILDASTPLTMKKYTGYYSCYGLMHQNIDANILPITKISGLFLIGQGVLSPGILGSMISSFLLDKIIYQND
jgi:all-trans-retinol 13,14-reductase